MGFAHPQHARVALIPTARRLAIVTVLREEENKMGAILQSLGRTVIAGVVLLIILILAVSTAKYDHAWGAFVMRWLHVMSGVMWIGLLWYFNFVQIPSMPKIPDEQKPAVRKGIAPTARLLFRLGRLSSGVR